MTSPTPDLGPLLTPEQYAEYAAATDPTRIAAATAKIRAHCRWHVGPSVTETIVLDGSGGRVLPVPSLRVTAVDQVLEDGQPVDVEWTESGLLRHPGRWSSQWRKIAVTLTHGFDPVPDELAQVVAEVAARLRAAGTNGMEKIGPFEFASAAAFTPDELDVLSRYRLPVLW